MNYKIEKKEAFRIVGVKKHFDCNIEENFSEIPQFWTEVIQNGMMMEIGKMSDQDPYGILGASAGMNGKDFDYYIAAATGSPTPQNMTEYEVPQATWAIFQCIGPMPKAIQELQKRIITEWLPTSGYEYADAPDIEVYPAGDVTAQDYQCEVWLPVKKK
ncbi:GyrI-like domain-containing protein [Tindallia californiensis]|nr:GyrI-like domain-containing protein [Tindallia californiensis]